MAANCSFICDENKNMDETNKEIDRNLDSEGGSDVEDLFISDVEDFYGFLSNDKGEIVVSSCTDSGDTSSSSDSSYDSDDVDTVQILLILLLLKEERIQMIRSKKRWNIHLVFVNKNGAEVTTKIF